MGYTYRCVRRTGLKKQCHAQKTFRKPLEHYKKTPKCPACGSNIHWWLRPDRIKRDDYCSCSGYHWTHRIKSRHCEHNPWHELYQRVERGGEEHADVLLDMYESGRAPKIDYPPDEPGF